MSIKRIVMLVVFAIAILIGLFHPLLQSGISSSASSSEPSVITNFDADYTVDNAGFLTATEVISVKFPAGRRGIFQFWDVADPANSKGRYFPTITSVQLDGKPEAYETSWQNGGTIYSAKIGKADVLLSPGVHTYVIRYTTPGVISPVSAGSEKSFPTTTSADKGSPESTFFWNVIAPGWQMPIAKANIKVNLPYAVEQVQCAAGTGSGSASAAATYGACTVSGAGTPTLTLTANSIPPVSGMTVRVTMAPTNPPQVTLPWAPRFDAVFGRSVPPFIFVLLLSIAVLVAAFFWARTSREPEPGFPVMYAPPDGLGPAQTRFMAYEDTGRHALVASLYYLADKRLVSLEKRSDDSWLVTSAMSDEQFGSLDPATRAVAASLGITSTGMWFLADKSVANGKLLESAKTSVATETMNWARSAGLVVPSMWKSKMRQVAGWPVLAWTTTSPGSRVCMS